MHNHELSGKVTIDLSPKKVEKFCGLLKTVFTKNDRILSNLHFSTFWPQFCIQERERQLLNMYQGILQI